MKAAPGSDHPGGGGPGRREGREHPQGGSQSGSRPLPLVSRRNSEEGQQRRAHRKCPQGEAREQQQENVPLLGCRRNLQGMTSRLLHPPYLPPPATLSAFPEQDGLIAALLFNSGPSLPPPSRSLKPEHQPLLSGSRRGQGRALHPTVISPISP